VKAVIWITKEQAEDRNSRPQSFWVDLYNVNHLPGDAANLHALIELSDPLLSLHSILGYPLSSLLEGSGSDNASAQGT
jgi:hypothetical protein